MLKQIIERAKRRIPAPLKEASLAARRWPRLLSARSRRLPDYIIIGAMRCGTSSLYHTLTEHPQVLPALRKEVRFFDWHYDRGPDWYRAHFPLGPAEGAGPSRSITGEASPEYIFHPLAPRRIAEALPDVRLIALLRDPVERAWSHYKLSVRLGLESLSFEDALDAEAERLSGAAERMAAGSRERDYQSFSYVSQGLYAGHLERWFDVFGPERIMVIPAEDMFSDSEAALTKIMRFLGTEPSPLRYLAMNAGHRAPMAASTRQHLEHVFASPNDRIAQMLGRRVGWE